MFRMRNVVIRARIPPRWYRAPSILTFYRVNSTKPFQDTPQRLPIQNKIGNFIVKFLKQESQALRHSLTDDSGAMQSILDELDPALALRLQRELDDSNKLFVLMSYNPVYIDPEIYLYFYDQVDSMDIESKNLLYRRLLFHQKYDTCWDMFNSSYTSINDVEEFLDLCINELKSLNNLTFGLLELITASQNPQLCGDFRALVLETICFKLKLNKDLIDNCISVHQDLEALDTSEEIAEYRTANAASFTHLYINHIYLKRLFLLMTQEGKLDLEQRFFDILIDYPDITSRPGWLALTGPKFPLSSFIQPKLHNKPRQNGYKLSNITLNELDIIYCINSGANIDFDTIYDIYSNSKKVDSVEKPVINGIFSVLIEGGSYELFKSRLVEQAQTLQKDLLVRSFTRLLDNTTDFQQIGHRFETLLPRSYMLDIMTKSIEMKYNEGYELDNTAELIRACNTLDNRTKLIRTILKYVKNDDEQKMVRFYRDIIKDIKSTQILLEVMRNMILRNDMIDKSVICTIFDKILHNGISKRPVSKEEVSRDFQLMYHHATPAERAHCHNSLRAMGQMFSLIGAQDFCRVITILHHHIGRFDYCHSPYGKNYIYTNIVKETMRFIDRGNDMKTAIFKMRDILGSLQCNATVIRGYIFKLMVKQDPSKSIKLLQFYQQKKSSLSNLIPYIISGIFETGMLSDNRKIQLFDMFLTQLNELGYRHKITLTTAHQLLKLVTSSPELNHTSRQWIASLSKKHKSIQRALWIHSKKMGDLQKTSIIE